MQPLAPRSLDDAPARPATERRAPETALEDALAVCAALASQLAALPALASPEERREALLRLPAALQAASLAVARLAAAGEPPPPLAGAVDALTGLADRQQLAAGQARLALLYPDTPAMLLVADVDHLRHVNQTWSHAVGDAVLQSVAGVLRAQSRPQDVIARVHGGTFAVALGGAVSTTRALLVAERLRAAIEQHAWEALGAGLRVTASVGVSARTPGEPLDEALARAARALQECKRRGRNQVQAG